MNLYEEVAHIPLFVHDPRHPSRRAHAAPALTQSIDIAPTFLDLFGVPRAAEMDGLSLLDMRGGRRPRATRVLFGYFGGAVNVTDGRYTYHRYPADLKSQEIYQYTLMPTHIFEPFSRGGAVAGEPGRAVPVHQGREAAEGAGDPSARRSTTSTVPAR